MKRGTLPPGIVIRSPRLRVDALAGAALGDVELAEAGEADLAAGAERVVIVSSTASTASVASRFDRPVWSATLVDELLLRHASSFVGGQIGAQSNSARGQGQIAIGSSKAKNIGRSSRSRPWRSAQAPPTVISPISSAGALTQPPNGTQRASAPTACDRLQHRDEVAGDRELAHRLGQLAARDQPPGGAHREGARRPG